MKTIALTFLKTPSTIVGIITAIMFQLLFSVIWMTGYQGVTDNTKNLRIAIVNEDPGLGSQITQNLTGNLPFQTEIMNTHEAAQTALQKREVQMVIHIPNDFSTQLQAQGQKAPITYTINESNPTMIKSVMQGVANTITTTVNKEVVAGGIQGALAKVSPGLASAQAQHMAQGLADKVVSDIQYTNKVKDMPNQMLPMMMVLASIVGTMIMAMNFQVSLKQMAGFPSSKWIKLTINLSVTLGAVIVIGLIGSSMVTALGANSTQGFMALWGFQTLFLLTFAFVAQMFLTLFGNAGMLFNISMLSLQLVSSGAMVPRELISHFYQRLSDFFPATYAVNGLMNILFGGPTVGTDVSTLLLITAGVLVIMISTVGLRKEKSAQLVSAKQQAA
jgi:YhgE/Pip-like protein